jgi:hypothetical protein
VTAFSAPTRPLRWFVTPAVPRGGMVCGGGRVVAHEVDERSTTAVTLALLVTLRS